ncbi:helix-turn-helix domain-containing protein [Lentzea sp. PSKA42]|uniref:Helix-turn-helix domain-containing protein n=1 Tax=Lentzea indica TaxID=2604800 RepID=A0ABX1FFY0_9PSEU|nr:helix-turn-helix transcriptional regulator [Lentzea indica]NKE57873.1 helix-turn-helix domain-containing protein [Lentzea indica]
MKNSNPLSDTLRALRSESGLSGAEAARRTGLSQSKVSRAETGSFLPSEDEILALCQVYGAPAEAVEDLVHMTRELREETTSARVVLQRGGWWMQQRIGKLEAAASRILSYSTNTMIGLLQTRSYAEALFGGSLSDEDRERTVTARLQRQELLDSAREFVCVMTEGVLRWNMGGAAVMVEQLDHLIDQSQRPNVRVGIIPWTTPAFVPAGNSFTMYDALAVMLGTQTATALITDEANIAEYAAHWAEIEPLVSWGDEARAVIDRVAADYRGLL